MSQPPKRGSEYSREREWSVILEDLQNQFRVFGEGMAGLHERLGGFELEAYKRFERLETEIASIKINYATKKDLKEALEPLATKEELKRAIEPLATKEELKRAIEPLATKEELKRAIEPLATKEELKRAIEPLATRKDIKILDRRLTALETGR